MFLDRGYFQTYPGQMITCLVGPSGARKSTAINIATGLLREIPEVNILSNKLSGPSFLDSLDRGMTQGTDGKIRTADSTGFLAAPELSVLLPKAQYVEEIIPIITDIFDAKPGPWSTQTRGHGKIELMSPLISGLWGSTPDWLETNIPQNAFGGGFMSRIFFIWHPKTVKSNPLPERSKRIDRLRDELLAELLWISNNIEGKVQWTTEAREWYVRFYKIWERKDDSENSTQRQGYNNRRPEHLLRIAIVMTVAENRNLILTKEILQGVDESLKLVESMMHRCFEPAMQPQLISKQFKMILDTLSTERKTKRELQRKLWKNLSAVELGIGLQTFVDAGMVEQIMENNTVYYQVV